MEPMVGFAIFFGIMSLMAFAIAFMQHREKRKQGEDVLLQNSEKRAKEVSAETVKNLQMFGVGRGGKVRRGGYLTTVQGHIGIGISLAFMVPLLITFNEVFLWLALGAAAATAVMLFVQWAKKNSSSKR